MSLSPRVAGAALGLSAAALFGVSTPIAKLLLPSSTPLVLASLLYLGGGLGLTGLGWLRKLRPHAPIEREARLSQKDAPLLLGVILCGGILGPVLMLVGLQRMSGVAASLLLNLEGPFTILLALLVFGEHLGRAGALAAAFIMAGAG
ncbi:EamA family transporter, partial [Myxococcus sp. AB036A]|uniref:EamA family transporter n=1 Tax=Myxococcus sp. AB036A TaxID=2562793 RepID=UPI0011473AB2